MLTDLTRLLKMSIFVLIMTEEQCSDCTEDNCAKSVLLICTIYCIKTTMYMCILIHTPSI